MLPPQNGIWLIFCVTYPSFILLRWKSLHLRRLQVKWATMGFSACVVSVHHSTVLVWVCMATLPLLKYLLISHIWRETVSCPRAWQAWLNKMRLGNSVFNTSDVTLAPSESKKGSHIFLRTLLSPVGLIYVSVIYTHYVLHGLIPLKARKQAFISPKSLHLRKSYASLLFSTVFSPYLSLQVFPKSII